MYFFLFLLGLSFAVQVAIKIISRAKLDQKMQDMVKREVSIMRMLSHPNVIRLYEVIETASHIFLVMEYASGGEVRSSVPVVLFCARFRLSSCSPRHILARPLFLLFFPTLPILLSFFASASHFGVGVHSLCWCFTAKLPQGIISSHWISMYLFLLLAPELFGFPRRFLVAPCRSPPPFLPDQMMDFIVTHGRLKERDARRFFRQVVAAIDYCHALRVIHRDLKAENLLLDGQFHVKVIDFGLSNRWAPGELLQTFCGSPTYTAPELIRRQRYEGPEIDVWSLGVLLYVLVCGSLPFDGNSFQELFGKIVHGDYFVPDHVSMECRDLIGRMLVVDPSQRATLDQVRTHRWVADEAGRPVPKADPLGFGSTPASKKDLDESALEECERIGFDRNAVIRSVVGDSYDDAAATYFLIVSRKRKDEELRLLRRQQMAEELAKAQDFQDRHRHLALSTNSARPHPHSAEPTPMKSHVHPRAVPVHSPELENIRAGSSSAAQKKYRKSDQRPTKRREPKSPGPVPKASADTPKAATADEAPPLPDPARAPASSNDVPPAHLRHRRHRTVGTTAEIMTAIAQDEQKARQEAEAADRAICSTPLPSGSPTILTPRSDSPESLSPRSPQKSPIGSPRSSVSAADAPPSPAREAPSISPPTNDLSKKKGHRRLSETSPQRRPVVIRDARELQLQADAHPDSSGDSPSGGPTIRVSQPSPRGHKRRSRPSSRDKGDPTTLTSSPSSGSISPAASSESASGVHKRHKSVDNEEPKPTRTVIKSPRRGKDKAGTPSKSPSLKAPRTSMSLEADDEIDEWVVIGNINSKIPASLSDSVGASPRHASEPVVPQSSSSSTSSSTSLASNDPVGDPAAKVPRHSSTTGVATSQQKTARTGSSGASERSWLDSLKRGISGLLQRGGSSKPEPRQARFPLNDQSTSHRAPEEILEQIKAALASLNIPYTLTAPFCLKCELETVGFEVEICRLPLLYLNGVRFRRIYGDAWRYTEYGREILARINLKDEAPPRSATS